MTRATTCCVFATVLLLIRPAPAAAQEATPFWTPAHETLPARLSDVAVGVALGLDVLHAVRSDDHRDRWRVACRTGLAIGISEVVKLLVHRTRPDGTDRKSFFSEHTAIASSAASSPLGASLAMTVSWGRMAAGKHYGSDVGVGVGVGVFSRRVCR